MSLFQKILFTCFHVLIIFTSVSNISRAQDISIKGKFYLTGVVDYQFKIRNMPAQNLEKFRLEPGFGDCRKKPGERLSFIRLKTARDCITLWEDLFFGRKKLEPVLRTLALEDHNQYRDWQGASYAGLQAPCQSWLRFRTQAWRAIESGGLYTSQNCNY